MTRYRIVYDHRFDSWVIERWRWYWPVWSAVPGLSSNSYRRTASSFYGRFPGAELEND